VALILCLGLTACNFFSESSSPPPTRTAVAPAAPTAPAATAGPTSAAADARQELVFNNGGEPETLDPALLTDAVSANLTYQLLEGLTVYDTKTLEPRPGAAAKWDISSDNKTYTFTLREDAKWSTGEAVTADDFVFAWTRALNPTLNAGRPSPYAFRLFPIKNAEAFNSGKITDAGQVGVKAKDKKTLEVTLDNPIPYFLQITAFHTLMPVSKAAVEKFGKDWTKPENYVGNGAFKLAEWKERDHVTLVKNPNYWDAKSVRLEKITALPIEDADGALGLYQRDQIDWARGLPTGTIEQWRSKPDLHSDPALILQYLKFNTTRKPLNDPRVRKALSMALDRKAIIDKVLKGGQLPGATVTPPAFLSYNTGPDSPAPKGLPEDLAQARKLLADAGFADGKNFPKLTVIYNTSAVHKAVYEAIQQQWKERLGVEVNLESQDFQVTLKNQRDLNYDLARAGYVGDVPDPNTFLGDLFTSTSEFNNTGWSNKKYDDLIKQANATLDPKSRYKAFADAEKLLVEDELPIAPIYFSVNLNLVKTWIKGMDYNLLDLHYLKTVYSEGKK
jgi:oligopeptide transport system substrate-binding protein